MDAPGKDYPAPAPEALPPEVVPFPRGNALTSLHRGIHCAATEAVETPPLNEVEALQVETFLDILAEIAQAIAQRESTQ